MSDLNRYLLNKKLMKIKYLMVCIFARGGGRIAYLKKHDVFAEIGENVLYQPLKLPNEPKLIKIHNNVRIAADVTFYTHDVINSMFSNIDAQSYQTHGSCIEIHDNVFIGGHSVIVGNVSIGPNAIIGAGSVVTKDVKAGTIVAGNPAVVVGSFERLHEKRMLLEAGTHGLDPNLRSEELWKDFYSNKDK